MIAIIYLGLHREFCIVQYAQMLGCVDDMLWTEHHLLEVDSKYTRQSVGFTSIMVI